MMLAATHNLKTFDYTADQSASDTSASKFPLWPLCTDGIMDKRSLSYDNAKNNVLFNPLQSCRLKLYSKWDVTRCFDEMQKRKNGSRQSHFVFIGDSRIRLYFYKFLEVI